LLGPVGSEVVDDEDGSVEVDQSSPAGLAMDHRGRGGRERCLDPSSRTRRICQAMDHVVPCTELEDHHRSSDICWKRFASGSIELYLSNCLVLNPVP
jgi:hypothetical protein